MTESLTQTTVAGRNGIHARPSRRRRNLALAAALTAGVAVVGFGAPSASAIVDGEPTNTSENPWQVSLQGDGQHFCGGSLVSDRVVVTAAHCTQGTPADQMTVFAGAADLDSSSGQRRDVVKVIENQKYTTGVGDIAMLVLDRPFDSSPNIAPIRTATSAEVAAASTARVTGWGTTSENGDDQPNTLLGADVPMVSDADCSLVDVGNDDELCAGGTGTDSCYGDSGGPLTIETSRGRVLAGVVSWGEECGGKDAGVYAEVPNYANWIAERIAEPDADAGERLPAQDFGDDFDDDFGDDFDDDFGGDFDDDFGGDDWFDQEFGEPNETDIENMTDAEFDEYINSLSDADFEQFLVENGFDIDESDLGENELDESDIDGTDTDGSESDTNIGDELRDDSLDEYDLNGDGIVQWNELAAAGF